MDEMSPNVVKIARDAVRYRAAAQLAIGELKDHQIAKQAGITKRQLTRWKSEPDFAALIAGINGDAIEAIKDEAVATKAGRLRILVDLHNKLLAIIESRAAAHAEEREWAAGESTGLIVTKETWGKVSSQEAAIDPALIKQIALLHDRIAIESGQRESGLTVRHTGRVDHVHRIPQELRHLSDDDLDALEAIALKAYEAEHEAGV